jgi:hypothetical protein
MATATSKLTKEVTLKLNEDETNYLLELLRNYIGPDEEPESDTIVRCAIFSALFYP